MFIIHHILLIAFSATFFAAENSQSRLFPNQFFLSETQPTPAFEKLLKDHSVACKSQTLTDVVRATQEQWMRPDAIERWELPSIDSDNTTVELFKELGLVDAIEPVNKEFDYAIIFGGTAQTMRKRLAYLLGLYCKGIQFKEIVFLVGDRKRDSVEESDEVLKNAENRYLVNKDKVGCHAQKLPSNETEIAQMIWNQAILFELSKIPVTFVHAPSTISNGIIKRPTTVDTVQTWKQGYKSEQPSRILAISSQPHIARQALIIQSVFPCCVIETAGPGTYQKSIPLFFDEIARYLFAMHAANAANS
jgi:hypothetical protein